MCAFHVFCCNIPVILIVPESKYSKLSFNFFTKSMSLTKLSSLIIGEYISTLGTVPSLLDAALKDAQISAIIKIINPPVTANLD